MPSPLAPLRLRLLSILLSGLLAGSVVALFLALGVAMAGCTTMSYATTGKDGQTRRISVTSWRSADEIAGMVTGGLDTAKGFLGEAITGLGGLASGGLGAGLLAWMGRRGRDKAWDEAEAKARQQEREKLLLMTPPPVNGGGT